MAQDLVEMGGALHLGGGATVASAVPGSAVAVLQYYRTAADIFTVDVLLKYCWFVLQFAMLSLLCYCFRTTPVSPLST